MPRRSSQADDGFIVPDDEELPDVTTTSARRRAGGSAQVQPGEGGFGSLPENVQDEMTNRLVRTLVCRNARKRPLRRADLTKAIFKDLGQIGNKNRVFHGVCSRAQMTFRTLFGMEMRKIHRRVKPTTARGGTASQKASMSQSQSTSRNVTTAYILVSTLPDAYRVALEHHKVIEIALLTLIAAIILLTPGCKIDEPQLFRWLAKVGIHVADVQPTSSQFRYLNGGNLKELIEKEWPEQWYLTRDKEDNVFHFSLCSRLFIELSDEHLINFIDAVYCIPRDNTMTLDETARLELKQRLSMARRAVQGQEDLPEDDDEEENDDDEE